MNNKYFLICMFLSLSSPIFSMCLPGVEHPKTRRVPHFAEDRSYREAQPRLRDVLLPLFAEDALTGVRAVVQQGSSDLLLTLLNIGISTTLNTGIRVTRALFDLPSHNEIELVKMLQESNSQKELLTLQMILEMHKIKQKKEEKKIKLLDEDLASKKLDNERKRFEIEQLKQAYRATTNTATASSAN